MKVLKFFTNSYNNTKHRSTGFAPNNINEENHHIVWQNLYGKYLRKKKITLKFKKGDKVHISIEKKTFVKGYFQQFSEESFEIFDVKIFNVPVYYLKDENNELIACTFYEEELEHAVT